MSKTLRQQRADEKLYGVRADEIRKKTFDIVQKYSGVELFDKISEHINGTLKQEREYLSEQAIDDFDKIEYYENNTGWETKEKHDNRMATLWGVKEKWRRHGFPEEY